MENVTHQTSPLKFVEKTGTLSASEGKREGRLWQYQPVKDHIETTSTSVYEQQGFLAAIGRVFSIVAWGISNALGLTNDPKPQFYNTKSVKIITERYQSLERNKILTDDEAQGIIYRFDPKGQTNITADKLREATEYHVPEGRNTHFGKPVYEVVKHVDMVTGKVLKAELNVKTKTKRAFKIDPKTKQPVLVNGRKVVIDKAFIARSFHLDSAQASSTKEQLKSGVRIDLKGAYDPEVFEEAIRGVPAKVYLDGKGKPDVEVFGEVLGSFAKALSGGNVNECSVDEGDFRQSGHPAFKGQIAGLKTLQTRGKDGQEVKLGVEFTLAKLEEVPVDVEGQKELADEIKGVMMAKPHALMVRREMDTEEMEPFVEVSADGTVKISLLTKDAAAALNEKIAVQSKREARARRMPKHGLSGPSRVTDTRSARMILELNGHKFHS